MNNKTIKPKEKMHSNNIRAILRANNVTQQELARVALNNDKSHLSRIINGKSNCISLPIAIRIAKALGKPVEKVFNYKEKVEQIIMQTNEKTTN
jgi:plasmid maintenance system antidote protein VapI